MWPPQLCSPRYVPHTEDRVEVMLKNSNFKTFKTIFATLSAFSELPQVFLQNASDSFIERL